MTINSRSIIVGSVALSACVMQAAEIITATRSGSGYFKTTETTATPWGTSAFSDNNKYVFVGDVNKSSNLYWGVLGFKMPPRAFTSASWVFERAYGGTITGGNVDLWCLGYKGTTDSLSSGCGSYADHMDMADTTRYLNGRAPVKVKDDFVLQGNALGATTTYSDVSLANLYALQFNRGATKNDYLVVRLNTDAIISYLAGSWRVKGLANEAEYTQAVCSRAVFTVPDREIVTPSSKYSQAERLTDGYFRHDVRWVHQIDDGGGFSFNTPSSVGCKNGKKQSVAFLVQVPPATTTNLNFTIVFNEPMAGSLPANINLELWSLGTITNRPNSDMLLSASDLEGQVPVKIGGPVLRGGRSVSPGESISLNDVNTRALGRYLNSLVRSGERDKWAVFKLEASNVSEADWQFGIGSAATPGEESFLEALAPVAYTNVFRDSGFENGFGLWSTGNLGGYDGAVTNCGFAYEGTNVLKIDINSASGGKQSGVSYNTYSGFSWFSNRLWKVCCAFRHDSSAPLSGSQYLNMIFTCNTGIQGQLGPRLLDGNGGEVVTPTDTWKITEWTGRFPSDAAGFMLFPNLRVEAGTVGGPTVYLDDIKLLVEEIVDFPREKDQSALVIMLR